METKKLQTCAWTVRVNRVPLPSGKLRVLFNNVCDSEVPRTNHGLDFHFLKVGSFRCYSVD